MSVKTNLARASAQDALRRIRRVATVGVEMMGRGPALIVALFGLAALPGAAQAAALSVDRGCYANGTSDRVGYSGTGFTPGQDYRAMIDGEVGYTSGVVNDDGTIHGAFAPIQGHRSGRLATRTSSQSATVS